MSFFKNHPFLTAIGGAALTAATGGLAAPALGAIGSAGALAGGTIAGASPAIAAAAGGTSLFSTILNGASIIAPLAQGALSMYGQRQSANAQAAQLNLEAAQTELNGNRNRLQVAQQETSTIRQQRLAMGDNIANAGATNLGQWGSTADVLNDVSAQNGLEIQRLADYGQAVGFDAGVAASAYRSSAQSVRSNNSGFGTLLSGIGTSIGTASSLYSAKQVSSTALQQLQYQRSLYP